jgi:hypothetical protein
MKKILKFTAILLIVAGNFSCGDKEDDNNNTLKGTKWKLAGIVDVQTGKLTELEPKDCEECYTLAFLTDTTAEGRSASIKIRLNLNYLGYGGYEKIGESADGDKFRIALYSPNLKSYTFTLMELTFINDVESYYLLFKPVKH